MYSFLQAWVEGRRATLPLCRVRWRMGVGLAPYHDTEKQIPSSIQAELAGVLEAIVEGSLTPAGRRPSRRRESAGRPTGLHLCPAGLALPGAMEYNCTIG